MAANGFRIPANTLQETLEALSRVVKEPNSPGVFRMKIGRRTSVAQPPITIAVFDEARPEHFNFPEAWLSMLAGGGNYFLNAFLVEENVVEPIGVPIPHTIHGEPRDVDTAVIKSAAWQGPRGLSFPPARPRPEQPQVSSLPDGRGVASPTDASGTVVRPGGVRGNGASSPPPPEGGLDELGKRWQELNAKEKELLQQAARSEVESVKRDLEARLDRVEADKRELERQLRFTPPPPAVPAAPQEDRFAAALEKLTPLILGFIKGQSDQRMELTRMQLDNQLAIAKAQAEASAVTAKQSELLLSTVLNRKDETSGALRSVLEAAAAQAKSQAEVSGIQTQAMVNLVASMSELGFGGGAEEESGFVKGIREVVRAVGTVMATQNQAARRVVGATAAPGRALPRAPAPAGAGAGVRRPPQQPPQRPAGPAPTARPPAPPPNRRVPGPGRQNDQLKPLTPPAPAPVGAGAGAKPPPAPPAPPAPAPEPMKEPTAATVSDPASDAAARAPEAPPAPPAPAALGDASGKPRKRRKAAPPAPAGPSVIELVMDRIRNRSEEPTAIAVYLIDNVGDPSVLAALQAADNDIGNLLEDYLGKDGWLDEGDNEAFANEVVVKVLRLGVERGLLPAAALEQADALERGELAGGEDEEEDEGEDAGSDDDGAEGAEEDDDGEADEDGGEAADEADDGGDAQA